MKLRKIFYGLLTVFGIRKLGYFIPYRYAGQVNVKNSANPWLLEWFSKLSNSVFLETLKSVQPYTADLKRIAYKNNRFLGYGLDLLKKIVNTSFDNNYFPK